MAQKHNFSIYFLHNNATLDVDGVQALSLEVHLLKSDEMKTLFFGRNSF